MLLDHYLVKTSQETTHEDEDDLDRWMERRMICFWTWSLYFIINLFTHKIWLRSKILSFSIMFWSLIFLLLPRKKCVFRKKIRSSYKWYCLLTWDFGLKAEVIYMLKNMYCMWTLFCFRERKSGRMMTILENNDRQIYKNCFGCCYLRRPFSRVGRSPKQ